MTPEGFIKRYTRAESRASFSSLDTYAQNALKQTGRSNQNRLITLQFAIWEMMGQTNGQLFNRWNPILLELAEREKNQRFIAVAKINQAIVTELTTGKFAEGDLETYAFKSEDWFVRSYALVILAEGRSRTQSTGQALRLLEQARAQVPPGAQDGDFPLRVHWETYGWILARFNDLDGATQAFARSEFQYKPAGLNSPDYSKLRAIMANAVNIGDERLARATLAAWRAASLNERSEDIGDTNRQFCAKIESAFGTPQAVLTCLDGFGLDSTLPRHAIVEVLSLRGLARAQLGQVEGARSDLRSISRLASNQPKSGWIKDGTPLITAELLARQGRGTEALALESQYHKGLEYGLRKEYRNAIGDLTGHLEDDLQAAQRNVSLQKSVIRFQWTVGILIMALSFGIAALLVWQRKMSRLHHAAQLRAEQANTAKSLFLANISHEIRTPLNGVLGMTQAIAADELSPRQRERLQVLQESGRGLLAILNDLLDLAKIEAGMLTLELVDCDLEALVTGCRDTFLASAHAKGLTLELQIEPDAQGLYRTDPTRLRQIIDNLVANAVKFTTTGGVSLRVDRQNGVVTLTVRDTGIGISDDAMGRIFSSFEQADSSTTRRFGGTGLGLSICQELAGAMGGTVSALSQSGEGSTFTVTLPLQRVGDRRSAADQAEEAPRDPTCPSLSILAAEDHPVNQMVLRTLLSQMGCKVTMVSDGIEALEQFRGRQWDLVLMDIQMPKLDGMASARFMREIEERQGRPKTPMIALTANAMAHQLQQYREAGFDDHITKPIEIVHPLTTINRVLSKADT